MNTQKITPAMVFPVANKIRKEQGCSMKEAYAKAKAQIDADLNKPAKKEVAPKAKVKKVKKVKTAQVAGTRACHLYTGEQTVQALQAEMAKRNVKFSFRNAKGSIITTSGTTRAEAIPTSRVVKGAMKPRTPETIVFYDVRHGQYRSMVMSEFVEILK